MLLNTLKKINSLVPLLLPSSCAICHVRQDNEICHTCLGQLIQYASSRKCIVCACLDKKLLCKYCLYAHHFFDQTIILCFETSFLVPLIRRCNVHGSIILLPSILKAWQIINSRHMSPVDIILPLPEPPTLSQKRGFWFSLELTKKLSQITKTPYNKDLIFLNNKPSLFLKEPLSEIFKINNELANSILVNQKRIAIVMPFMISESILNDLAKILKAHGALWVSYWVLTRKLKKDSY